MTTALTTKQPTDIGGLLEVNKGAILQVLPKTIQADRFLRVCLNAISRNPQLQKCTAASLFAGIVQSAQFGLEIGLMNQAHLVPYWNSEKRCFEAQFQIGYLGLRDLGERYGDVKDGDAQAVYEKDLFDYAYGDTPYLTHKPSKEQHRGEIVHFYAWAKPKEGQLKVAVMSKEEVDAHRDRFVRRKTDGSFGPAWTVNFEAMGLKTVMRRCYKFLARSPELREAIALDEMQEVNIPQNLGIEVEAQQHAEAREANAIQLQTVQEQLHEPRRKDAAEQAVPSALASPEEFNEARSLDVDQTLLYGKATPSPVRFPSDIATGTIPPPYPVADAPPAAPRLTPAQWVEAIDYLADDRNRNDILKVVLAEFKARSCAVLPANDRVEILLRVMTLCHRHKIPCRALLPPYDPTAPSR